MSLDRNYQNFKSDEVQEAMRNLKGEQFKLWVFFMMNQSSFSQKTCEEWGIKKDSYYRGVEELRKKGYLKRIEDGSYEFYAQPRLEVKDF